MAQEERCVVLGREKRSQPWELLFLRARSAVFRTAKEIKDQEDFLGNKGYQVMVVTEDDYDKKRFREIHAPPGYDFTIPSSLPPREAHVPKKPEEPKHKPHENLGKFA
jgi:hypothetical protein